MRASRVLMTSLVLASGCAAKRMTASKTEAHDGIPQKKSSVAFKDDSAGEREVAGAESSSEVGATSSPPRDPAIRSTPQRTVDLKEEDDKPAPDRPVTPPPPAPPSRVDETLRGPPTPSRPPAPAGVRAGASDDNLQFNAFLRFLDEIPGLGRQRDVSHRVVLTVADKNGLPVANAKVTALLGDTKLATRTTYSDGRALLFPSLDPRMKQAGAELSIETNGASIRVPLRGPLVRRVSLDMERSVPPVIPLDVVFVLDTTGSMGDEIEQLRRTIQVIHWQVSNMSPKPDVRFGMVLYKDQEDEYVTRVVPFTGDLQTFQRVLAEVSAGGGGDTPEDVEAALEVMTRLPWRPDGVRLAFLIGDAAPHLDYPRPHDYLTSTEEAASKGIKVASIGASGLDRMGELVWRQVAQYTMAPFVFLTYGETSDAEGSPSSVSHHVGSNWVADSLDAIVVKMVKVELASFGATGAPDRQDFFEANASSTIGPDAVLEDLFRQSIKQLMDYAVEPIPERSPTSVLPVAAKRPELAKKAERLASRLELAFGRGKSFQLIETKSTPKLMELVAAQMGSTFDPKGMVEVGRLVPARFAVLSQLDEGAGGGLELVVKLVRLETGEVLSMSLMRIEPKLLS
ncbi:MAG: VWA domain-containing protein [Deltaproteobacteria bacterium]|nr:VWA domain-containing protein [Deltaproteobacteria bacterium]